MQDRCAHLYNLGLLTDEKSTYWFLSLSASATEDYHFFIKFKLRNGFFYLLDTNRRASDQIIGETERIDGELLYIIIYRLINLSDIMLKFARVRIYNRVRVQF